MKKISGTRGSQNGNGASSTTKALEQTADIYSLETYDANRATEGKV